MHTRVIKVLKKNLKENKGFIVFLLLMFIFRSAVADWSDVPTGSMKPTIVEGDRILVNKMAYDIRIPFTHISLKKLADPKRGDIVVFDSQVSDKRLVKRVIGVPGDFVSMIDNVLYLNGEQLQYKTLDKSEGFSLRSENLKGVIHAIKIQNSGSSSSSFSTVQVPEGYYLALGDNRDNSADSRVIGFVPREEIVGRSRTVVLSLDYDNYYIPRSDRFMHSL